MGARLQRQLRDPGEGHPPRRVAVSPGVPRARTRRGRRGSPLRRVLARGLRNLPAAGAADRRPVHVPARGRRRVALGRAHDRVRRARAAPRRRSRLARLRRRAADPRARHVALVRHRQLRAHARAGGALALARPRLARGTRPRRADRAQADLPAAARLARLHTPLALRRARLPLGGRSVRGRVGGHRLRRARGLSAPARGARRHRAGAGLLERLLRALARPFRGHRHGRALRARHVRHGAHVDRAAPRRPAGRRARLPARDGGADRVLADRLAALPRAAARAARGAAPAAERPRG